MTTDARPLHEWPVDDLARALRAGELSATALTRHALDRVRALDDTLHAFITVTTERALADAARADDELARGVDRGPLHGIPYALKDVFDTEGIRTTANSWVTLDHVPTADAEVERRLLRGGAVLLGKVTTHEFALGGPSWELPFPPARNPWNVEHFTGASSSGSGAAVAARMVRVSIGTDTSGSVRGPAAHCGVVGLKPTYGLVSRRGAFPLSYALDHCGPLAPTVREAALTLGVVAGHDPADPSSVDRPPVDYARRLERDAAAGLRGTRIGYAREFFVATGVVADDVLAALDAAAETLARGGADVDEVALPDFALFNACGRVLMTAESYAIHERWLRAVPSAYGRYTYQRVVPGATLTAADVVDAHRMRRRLAAALTTGPLARYDVLVTGNALTTAARFADFPEDWPPPRHATATLTIPFNVTGHPALAVPVAMSRDGLPIGMQIVGRYFDEATVLRVGAAFEAVSGLADARPPLPARHPGIVGAAERDGAREGSSR